MSSLLAQATTVLVFCLLGSATSLATWLGFDRKNLGPWYWFSSFLVYALAVFLSLFSLGKGLYSPFQIPVLALVTVGNWLQYAGFRSLLRPDRPPLSAKAWTLVLVAGVAASALSFGFRSPLLTFGLEDLMSVIGLVLALGILLGRHRPVNLPLQLFATVILVAILAYYVLSLGAVVVQAATAGPLGEVPKVLGLLGPGLWMMVFALLSIADFALVTGVLVEEKAMALAKAEDVGRELAKTTADLAVAQRETLGTMAMVVENRTEETATHVERVAALTEQILLRLGYAPPQAKLIADASRLHDIGKVGLADGILKNPGQLSPQERQEMQKHTLYGAQILSRSTSAFFQVASKIAVQHHERWDGGGYPLGLTGTEICTEARVVAIADTFDALVSRRSYKEAWPPEAALDWIRSQAGTMFDPELVQVLEEISLVSEES